MITKENLSALPRLPGIYLFKDSNDAIIYIGKAKSIYDRVQTYFQRSIKENKVALLITEYKYIDFIITHTELEALFLEADLIQKHKPKFNALLKEGNPFIYILFTNTPLPNVEIVRTKAKKGSYYGPFLYKTDARKAANFLIRTFRLNRCNKTIANGCLDYHIGTCAGSCRPDFNPQDYLFRIELAQNVLKKDHKAFIEQLKTKIKEYSKELAFEKARNLTYYLDNMHSIFTALETAFTPKKYLDQIVLTTLPKKYTATLPPDLPAQLQEFLQLPGLVHSIDCFDISHFQSKEIVGSCIRFVDGLPDKNRFRRFKVNSLDTQNDYAALQEIVTRRYRNIDELPDLILIDGGKGQLSAVQSVLPQAHIISLAKREEQLFGTMFAGYKMLDAQNPAAKVLLELRDYAHHFAISYHRLRRRKNFKTF